MGARPPAPGGARGRYRGRAPYYGKTPTARAALPQLQYHGGAIAEGRVTLSQASVDQLPAALSGHFDAVLAVHPDPSGG